MVIVNIEIAFNVDFHAEAAVGGDLIKHMIEKAHAGADFAAAFAIQPHFDVNLRLFGLALNMRVAIAFGQLLANGRPVQGFTVVTQPGNAHVGRQFNIRCAIANDVAVRFIQRLLNQPALNHFYFRFAAITLIAREVRANQHLFELHAL